MKLKLLFLSLFLSLFLTPSVLAYNISDITTARKTAVDLKSFNGATVDGQLPSEYSFALGVTNNPEIVYGSDFVALSDEQKTEFDLQNFTGKATLLNNSIVGKYNATYKNVGIYNGQQIDVKLTLMAYEVEDANQPAAFWFLPAVIANSVSKNVKYVTIKYDFYKTGTTTPVSVKGNTTYWDVDAHQGVIIENNNKGIYTKNNNVLKITSGLSVPYIFESNLSNSSDAEEEYAFTETFEGSTITRSFTYGQHNNDDTWSGATGNAWMFHSAISSVPIQLESPVLSLSKEKIAIGEEFEYIITQKVPLVSSNDYFNSFVIDDTLADCLVVDTSGVVVKDKEGNDVTNKFTITAEGQKIILTLKNTKEAGFYGKTYDIFIKTMVKDDSDLTPYQAADKFIIANKANVTVDNDLKCTNQGNVELVPEVLTEVPSTASYASLALGIIGSIFMIVSVFVIYYKDRRQKEAKQKS